MSRSFLPSALALLAPFAAAQNCFDGDFGTRISPQDPNDVLLPRQPIGFPFPIGGQTWTDVHVSDHGYVQLSNGGVPAPAFLPQIYTPTTANFVGGSPKVCALYADIVGGFGGGASIWLRSSPTQCTITWRNMQNFGIASPRFHLQLTLFANGDVRMVFGPNVTNDSTYTSPSDSGICGITPGNNAVLPSPLDLSAGGTTAVATVHEAWTVPNTFDLQSRTLLFVAANPGYTVVNLGAPTGCGTASDFGSGCGGLELTSVGLPTLGNASFLLRIAGIPTSSPAAFVAFGDTAVDPGLPLAPIGMPGCEGYTNLGLGMSTAGPVVAGASDFVLAIPSSPAIVGTLLAAQGVAIAPVTPLGLIASNGTRVAVGFGH